MAAAAAVGVGKAEEVGGGGLQRLPYRGRRTGADSINRAASKCAEKGGGESTPYDFVVGERDNRHKPDAIPGCGAEFGLAVFGATSSESAPFEAEGDKEDFVLRICRRCNRADSGGSDKVPEYGNGSGDVASWKTGGSKAAATGSGGG